MVYLIILNWFDWSGVRIWNRFIVIFKWKLWRVNLNITIINGIMIKSPHDSWNNMTGLRRRVTRFEANFRSLAFPLSWYFSWFITMKDVELVHLSSGTWWDKVRATDDAGIRLVSNSSTAFTNSLLYHAYSCNNWLESWCIIFDGKWRTKMMRALTWDGQGNWISNHLKMTIDSINFSSCVDSQFSVFVKESHDIGECFELVALSQYLHVPEEKSCRRDSFYIEDNFLLKYDNYAMKIFNFVFVFEHQGG